MNVSFLVIIHAEPKLESINALTQQFFATLISHDGDASHLQVSELCTAQKKVYKITSTVQRTTLRQWCLDYGEQHQLDCYCLDEQQVSMQPKLLLSDMDSTMISIEVIDELAKHAGVGEKVQAVTEQAMKGLLDFDESLRARVAQLEGLDLSAIETIKASLPLSPGARELITTARAQRCITALVSGGFLPFVKKLQDELGFEHILANQLLDDGKQLLGTVKGDIVNGQRKAEFLLALSDEHNLNIQETVTIGDGANDLLMMKASGLSVAYKAKPVVNEQADISIRFGDLRNLIYHFGW